MNNKKLYELTNPQKSIWLTEQYYNDTTVNNICSSGTIYGNIDIDLLKKAINNVVKQNDGFRIHIVSEGNIAKQYIADYKEFNIDVEYINDASKIEKVEKEEVKYKFNIIDSDLFKFKIVIFKEHFASVILTVNHMISDSWSMGITIQEILRNYNCLKNNEEAEQETFSYVDYINAEKEYKSSKKYENDKNYWNEMFETIPEQATIPSLKNNVKDLSYNANRLSFDIDKKILEKINYFCKENNFSTFNFFMAIFSIYIGRVSNIDDFVIGTPILNRTNFKEKHTTGMFVNTVPVRVSNLNDGMFKDLGKNFAQQMMGILRHQKYSYNSVLEDLRTKNENVPNLYNIIISYQITKAFDEKYGNYKTNWTFNNYCANDFNIHIYDINDTGSLIINYDYLVDKYSEEDVTDVHNRIINMINQVIDNNQINLKDIEIITPEEKDKILNVFNNTAVDYPRNKTIVDLFEEQVEKTPNNIAVVFEDNQLTYRELNEKANSLANYLVSKGIKNNDIIGIMPNRSLEMVVGLLAILKAGAAYLPIDPEYPAQRIAYMLDNSNSKVVLVTEKTDELVENNYNKMNISLSSDLYKENNEDNLNIKISSSQLMYLIYTSGSTGNPKGVMITHNNIHNFIVGMKKEIDFASNKTMVSLTTICFDIFGLEIWCSLTQGLKLVVANEFEQKDVKAFNKLCLDNKVDMATPSRFLAFLEDTTCLDYLDNLTEIMVGGEPLPENLLSKLKNYTNAKIYNMYGPTETTVWSTIKNLSKENNITIGKPIANTVCYILDNNQKLLPPLTIGTLYIGGEGVSNGYYNKQKLTSEKFIKYNNKTIYNTNDLAYYTKSGEIVHLGRDDFQVKIRGYRVELGEIENAISNYTDITSCAVICHNKNNKQILCAYYTSATEINIDNLRNNLIEQLPLYMVPSKFIHLDKLPYTPNGKIDRKALKFEDIDVETEIVLPKNDIEQQLYDIVKDITNNDQISVDEDLFALGMDSIDIIHLSTKIKDIYNIDISIRDLYSIHSLINLAELISKNTFSNAINNIEKAEKKDYYELSSAQKRIYYASNLDGKNSILYNIPGVIIFNKQPNKEKLNNCLNTLIKRHEGLRTCFTLIENNVKQQILSDISFEMETSTSNIEDINLIAQEFIKPFDLSKAPLFRAKLITTKNKFLLLYDMHHIISDGLSLSILASELCKLYNDEELEPINLRYIDFAEWESLQLKNNNFNDSKDFWVNQFSDEIPVLNLPTDYPRTATQSYNGNKIYNSISGDLAIKINKLSKKLNISNYMFLLSCYYVLLSKYTLQEDIVIGSPALGRNQKNLLNIIGMFVNSLPLRAHVDNNMKFKEFLDNVKHISLKAMEYGHYPFDELVKDLNIKRDSSRNPLFDTMFIYQNNPYSELQFDDIKADFYVPNTNISKFDLSLEILPINGEFKLSFEYATALFNYETIEKLSEHYINIIKSVLNNVHINISDIDLFSDEEKNKILFEFNNTQMDYDKDKTIVDLFEEQVEKTPNNTAIVFGNKSLTFKELNEKANSLAYHLKINKQINRNDIVGVMLSRSLEVIVSILAVLKAGGTYIPIDPNFPKERIDYMLDSSNAKLLLTEKKIENKVNFDNKISIDLDNNAIYDLPTENLEHINNPDDLMYIIFTSGTTGKPKGVMVTHKVFSNFTNYCNNYVEYLKNPKYQSIVSITTISFDIFAYETLISLQKGLKLVIANENEQTTPHLLNALMEKNDVKIIQSTPSVMQIFVNSIDNIPALKKLKYIILAGEQLPLNLVKSLHNLSDIVVYNGYGPSETYYCTLTKVNNDYITIGKPIYNSQMYILDNNLNPVPIGSIGEIYISGECVGKGYLNRPDLTEKTFIPNPFINGLTMYKSGDLGKYMNDGNIICLGRLDHQVKIRGLRIELEEIESLMLKYSNISKVAVVKQSIQNREFISAYYVANKRISTNELRKYLSEFLPRYMVPSYYIPLDDLPYTPNGKIDKKSLPLPTEILNISEKNYIAPKTDIQKQLVTIWEKILNTKPIGINDNFFELGGDSLLAMNLNLELSKITDKITYQDIFHFPTISELEDIIISDTKKDNYKKVENLPENIIGILKNTQRKEKLKKYHPKNILLTGCTGFLGVHILDELLKFDNTNIYCIVRNEPGLTAEYKLLQKLNYYFGKKYDNLINKRIFMVTGDICNPGFGLNQEDLLNLANSIDIVINSAANVSHFGNYNNFYKTNVLSVKYMIDFCNSFKKKFYHVSTMGVAGLTLNPAYLTGKNKNTVIFDESSLYIGQIPETVYTYTKFEAEVQILNAVSNGLDAYILRMGNLMPRYSDGLFQENALDNEFINKMASFIRIGAIPNNLMNYSLEITPVDYAAKAICKIITHQTNSNRIFHLFDYKRVSMLRCLNLLRKANYKIDILSEKDFIDRISNILNDDESKGLLEFILNDFDENKHISYEANMNVKSNFTRRYLRKTLFIWPRISNKYLKKFLKILRKVI